MKYIKKTPEPDFFKSETEILKLKFETTEQKSGIWDEYRNKRKLKEHILEKEQNYLCCYCEAKVTLENSHIEHIKPKSLDYDNLTFDYNNLLISCNGTCFSSENKPKTCGHKKENKFNENLFLNPIVVENIRAYFIYTDNGYIGSSSLCEKKAKYTMELLQLNTFNNYLPEARVKALEEFRKSVTKFAKQTKKDIKEIAISLLNKENLAFISFLKFKYKNLSKGVTL